MGKLKNAVALGHLLIFMACAIWGLMAPLGKHAMSEGTGVSGLDMVSFRVLGGALCFWILSIFTRKEHVPRLDVFRFMFAAIFGIVCNQCLFTVGLSETSPVHASIMTTTMPIITLLFSAIFLKEGITLKKGLGLVLGITGALILIIGSSQSGGSAREANLLGDLMVIGAQFSYAFYLTKNKDLICRYSVVTSMKWMIGWAAVLLSPLELWRMSQLGWSSVPTHAWWEIGFVVFCGTFIAYIMTMKAQKVLRPTIISVYNYVQPMVSCVVSVAAGLAIFGWKESLAVVLVFTGVWLVAISKQ